MPLSISKLNSLVQEKGYVPYQYFTIDHVCVYMTVMSLKTAEIFLLYFPSSYSIEIPFSENVYKLRYIELQETDNTADKYAGQPDPDVDMTIQLSPDRKVKMEQHLETHYQQPINLKDISNDELAELQGIYRQLKRLSNCVSHIKYKVGVIFNSYLCAIHRDGTIDSYMVKHYRGKPSKNLIVILDIELFYEKADRLDRDIQTVRNGIYKVLERNHVLHADIIEKMVASKQSTDTVASEIVHKKEKYTRYISDLEKMLSGLATAEEKRIKELKSTEDSRARDTMESQLDHIQTLKHDIIKYLMWTKEKREHTLLSMDKIMFDNTVMFDCILQNFTKLNNFR